MPTAEPHRLLIVSPVRNEAEHIERTAAALAAQTRPPDLWIVVDDGSDDATPVLLRALSSELPFMRVMTTPAGYTVSAGDRHAVAASPRAFNWALRSVAWRDFTHIGKLDGDIELPPSYFGQLLQRFHDQPDLGIAGGTLVEELRGAWRTTQVPSYHVRGALKLYSLACFEAIGGVEERLGWDTIDETYARMHGYTTHSFSDLVAKHHRQLASADGELRGRARYGRAAYTLRYGPGWVALRSVKVAGSKPIGLSGMAFLWGYAQAALTSSPKVEDEEFRRFVRRELRGRLLRPVSRFSARRKLPLRTTV